VPSRSCALASRTARSNSLPPSWLENMQPTKATAARAEWLTSLHCAPRGSRPARFACPGQTKRAYTQLETLHKKYHAKGFNVLAFP